MNEYLMFVWAMKQFYNKKICMLFLLVYEAITVMVGNLIWSLHALLRNMTFYHGSLRIYIVFYPIYLWRINRDLCAVVRNLEFGQSAVKLVFSVKGIAIVC